MRKTLYTILTAIILFMVTGHVSHAQDKEIVIDSLLITNGNLALNFHTETLFDESVLDGIEKGFTVNVTFQMDLWKARSNCIDKNIVRTNLTTKIRYNKFNQRYILFNEQTGERLETFSFDKVENRCTVHTNIALTDTTRLREDETYYAVIEGILEPLSVENIDEMRKWLGGEVEDLEIRTKPVESPKKLTSSFLSFIKNITGFGDQHCSVQSQKFMVHDDRNVVFIMN